jgi:hypothetical protein
MFSTVTMIFISHLSVWVDGVHEGELLFKVIGKASTLIKESPHVTGVAPDLV